MATQSRYLSLFFTVVCVRVYVTQYLFCTRNLTWKQKEQATQRVEVLLNYTLAKWRSEFPFLPPRYRWSEVWSHIHQQRVSVQTRSLAWCLLHCKLPLRSHQWIRTIYNCSDRCVMCGALEETYVVHLFCKCPVVQPLWGIFTHHLLRRRAMKGV